MRSNPFRSAGLVFAALVLLSAADQRPSLGSIANERVPAPQVAKPAGATAAKQTLTAGIYGADVVPYSTWCYYAGWASGGTPPYTFAWISVGGLDDEWWSGNQYGVLTSDGPRSIEMWMTVRDANGGYVEVMKQIDKSSNAYC